MFMKVLNYSIRALIILVGIFMLFIYTPPKPNIDMTFVRTMGGIMILFGVYRIVIYYYEQKKYNFMIKEDENENDEN